MIFRTFLIVILLSASAGLFLLPIGCSDSSTQASQAAGKASAEKPNPTETAMSETTNTVVIIETSLGKITVELWADKSPETVENFLRYTDEEFFDGLIFHRVINGFMIQGGGFDTNMTQKAGHDEIRNEASADVTNDRGTLAMARTSDINSASSQFFINLNDNAFLNHSSKTPQGFGYCVFAKVTDGMDVVDKIAAVATGSAGHFDDVPTEAVVIKSIRRAE